MSTEVQRVINRVVELECAALSTKFSLNVCDTSLKSYVYFNISSSIFFILFSCSLILLTYIDVQYDQDPESVWLYIYNRNLLIYQIYTQSSSQKIRETAHFVEVYFGEIYDVNVIHSLKWSAHNSIFWWEPWSFEVLAIFPPFNKKFFNSPWHFYYKYRLSSWVRWHILEDRICIFVLFFLFILI